MNLLITFCVGYYCEKDIVVENSDENNSQLTDICHFEKKKDKFVQNRGMENQNSEIKLFYRA